MLKVTKSEAEEDEQVEAACTSLTPSSRVVDSLLNGREFAAREPIVDGFSNRFSNSIKQIGVLVSQERNPKAQQLADNLYSRISGCRREHNGMSLGGLRTSLVDDDLFERYMGESVLEADDEELNDKKIAFENVINFIKSRTRY